MNPNQNSYRKLSTFWRAIIEISSILLLFLFQSAIGELVYAFATEHIPQCTKVEVTPSNYNQEWDGYWCTVPLNYASL